MPKFSVIMDVAHEFVVEAEDAREAEAIAMRAANYDHPDNFGVEWNATDEASDDEDPTHDAQGVPC